MARDELLELAGLTDDEFEALNKHMLSRKRPEPDWWIIERDDSGDGDWEAVVICPPFLTYEKARSEERLVDNGMPIRIIPAYRSAPPNPDPDWYVVEMQHVNKEWEPSEVHAEKIEVPTGRPKEADWDPRYRVSEAFRRPPPPAGMEEAVREALSTHDHSHDCGSEVQYRPSDCDCWKAALTRALPPKGDG